ncbi:MAG: alpha/beta hydrolase [Phycisphaerae bacterium]|nr:alpha/beta hydrolase [Saprospiraceae bacterium]
MKSPAFPVTILHKRGHSTTLVVLLHAFNRTSERLADVRRVVEEDDPNADILAPNLPFSFTSMVHPSSVVADLLIQIDQAFERSQQDGSPGYQRIRLIGHSMGALFVRKLYVCACGEHQAAPFEASLKDYLKARNAQPLSLKRPWADSVDRIILLAAMNRGWSVSHHQSLSKAFWATSGVFIGHIMGIIFGRMPIVFSVRRGAPFLTQLRLQWLFMRRAAQSDSGQSGTALTVQLLGSVDDLISPNDNVDLVAGKDFIYLDVPESGHSNIVEMDDSEEGRARRNIFKAALTQPSEVLKAGQLLQEDVISIESEKVTDVVFVIHGIRDEGYWTQKIARRVMVKGQEMGLKFASETSSYGYFPMLSFLNPLRRREKVEWLMDQYAEACARYPTAERFHYVGHSNGTYLLARALSEYPACRFHRVVFAGSVVQRQYNWQQFMPRQVGAVLNFVASQDWVVAYFPKGLQSLKLQDLGSAGHDGFIKGPDVFQPDDYIQGGHSAALNESMWDGIANFLVTNPIQIPALPASLLSKQRPWWVRYPVWPLVWLGLLGIMWFGYWVITYLAPAEWAPAFVLVYLFLLWKIVTKV